MNQDELQCTCGMEHGQNAQLQCTCGKDLGKGAEFQCSCGISWARIILYMCNGSQCSKYKNYRRRKN